MTGREKEDISKVFDKAGIEFRNIPISEFEKEQFGARERLQHEYYNLCNYNRQ